MDLIFYYCDVCTRRISQPDLNAGKAVATSERRMCSTCMNAGGTVQAVIPAEKKVPSNSKIALSKDSKSSIPAAIREAQPPRRRPLTGENPGQPVRAQNPALTLGVMGGLIVIVILGFLLAGKPGSTAKASPPPAPAITPPANVSVDPTVTANVVPPAPLAISERDVAAEKAFSALLEEISTDDKDAKLGKLKSFIEKFGDTASGPRARVVLSKLESSTVAQNPVPQNPIPLVTPTPPSPGPVRVTLVVAPAGREFSLQAKQARISSGLQLENRYNGTQVAYWKSTNEFASWLVRIPTPATYKVSLTYACARDNGGMLVVEGGKEPLRWQAVPTRGWTDFTEANIGTISLDAGDITLKFRADTLEAGRSFPSLRAIRLTPVEGLRPDTAPPNPGTTPPPAAAVINPVLEDAHNTVALAQVFDTLKEAASLASKSRFDDAAGLLNQKIRSEKDRQVVELLRQEQADMEALDLLRDRILDQLKEQKGKKIKIERNEGVVSDRQNSGTLGVKVSVPGGGSLDIDLKYASISLKDILEYAPAPKTAEELSLFSFWEFLLNNEPRGLEWFRKALDAGLASEQADAFRLRYTALRNDAVWKLLKQGDEQLVAQNNAAAVDSYRQLEKSIGAHPFKPMLVSKLEKRLAFATNLVQQGLEAAYFNDENFGKEVLRRVESRINVEFNGAATPDKSVHPEHITVRWTGFLKAPKAGTYEIIVEHNDGARLWINDKNVIDAWNSVKTNRIQIELPDQPVPFKLEYQNTFADGVCRVRWRGPGEAQETEISGPAFSHQK